MSSTRDRAFRGNEDGLGDGRWDLAEGGWADDQTLGGSRHVVFYDAADDETTP